MSCIRCGYDLSATALDGRCPECGVAARLSRFGTLLVGADEASLRLLARGAGLVFIVLALLAFWPFIGVLLAALLMASLEMLGPGDSAAEAFLETVIGVATSAAMVALAATWAVGWQRVARACADPGIAQTAGVTRRWTVGGAVAGAAAVVVVVLLSGLEASGLIPVPRWCVRVVVWLVLAGLLTSAITGLLLCRAVIAGTSDEAAKRRARVLLYSSPVLIPGLIPPLAEPLLGLPGLMRFTGCVTMLAWLWVVIDASLMSLVGRNVRRAREIRRSNPSLRPAADPEPAGTL